MNVRLTVRKGKRTLESLSFDEAAPRILIGRNEDCDVQIESDSVSRHHCELLLDEGFHRLVDLSSRHGTFVNGRRVSEASLNSGDELTLGEFNVTYTAEFTDVGRVKPYRPGAAPTIEVDAPQGSTGGSPSVARARGHLTYWEGGRERNFILDQATTILGSAENADVKVTGWFASRISALILRERFSFRLLDTSGKGRAVWVNGRPTRDLQLNSGDEIVVHRRLFRFFRGLPKLDAGAG